MKRFICILLALIMVLSMAACGKEESPNRTTDTKNEAETKLETESKPETESKSEEESTPETESKPEEESQPQPEAEKPPIPSTETGVLPLSVMFYHDSLVEWGEGYSRLAYVAWDEVYLEGPCAEEYPHLVDALNYVNRSFRGWSDKDMVDLTERAKTQAAQMGEDFTGFESNNCVYVQRADSRVFSLLSQRILSDGQAMGPSYSYSGVNLDSTTGLQVTIDLVLTDMHALPQLLEEALVKKYADYPDGAFGGMAEKLKSYTPRDYKWTIGYQGVTFYFDEQELLTPHHGGVSVTLWFQDHPDLFVEAYTQCPKNGYASALPLGTDVEVDLKPGDGKTERLYIAIHEDKSLQIEVDQSHYLDEYFGYYMEAYLVTPDNQNFYLYIESHSDNDYSTIHIYSLKTGGVVPLTELNGLGFEGVELEHAEYGETYYTRFFNDPTRYSLYTRSYLLSTVSSARFYHTDPKTGIPQPDTDYYTMDPSMPPLISKISLKVKMLPGNTTKTLPAGTKFYFLRTDNKTYVDMRLEDGRECRIHVVHRDWELFVNGVSEYECFEELMYAG